MNTALNKKIISFITAVLLPFLIVKLLWTFALFFLEKKGVDFIKEKDYTYFYKKDIAVNILPIDIKAKPKTPKEPPAQKLNNLILKGTFIDKNGSFIVVEDDKKTVFIDKGEKYKGYTLIEVQRDRAVFLKNSKRFEITVKDDLPKEESLYKNSDMPDFIPPEMMPKSPSVGGNVAVSREVVNRYMQEPGMIWKNITIDEIRKNNKLKGFRVSRIKKGSYFYKLGLREGDIIKAIDGREFKSIAQVMHYYNNISKINALSLTIMRGSQEMELFFDIN